MSNVVSMEEFKYPWHEVFTADDSYSTLRVYYNDRTGALEFTQTNDAGEVIRSEVSAEDAKSLVIALTNPPKR